MQITTETDFINTFKKLGIEKGSVVLLQGDLSAYEYVVNQEQAVIDALMKLVTNEGCILMPTFTLNCLDPASYETKDVMYEDWSLVREYHMGFDPQLTTCSKYTRLAEQFLKNPGVKRTDHPVYSFAFWGTYDEKCLEQPLHLPISFGRVLRDFVSRDSYNLLLNETIENSLLFPALAKTMNLGVLTEKKAIVRNNDRVKIKSFLNLEIDSETLEQCLDLCWVEQEEDQRLQIVSLDTNDDKM